MTIPLLERTPEMTPQGEQPTPWGPFNGPSFPHLRPELTISSPPPPHPSTLPSGRRRAGSRIQDSRIRAVSFAFQNQLLQGTCELLWGCSPSGREEETEAEREKEPASSCSLDAEDRI